MFAGTKPLSSEKLAWGLTLMSVALLMDSVLAGYSLANLGVEIDPGSLAATQPNPLQIVLSCMSPLSTIFKFVAALLVFADSKRLSELGIPAHRKLAGLAIAALVISLISGGAVLFLAMGATLQGDLNSLIVSSWVNTVGSILGFAVGLLLVYAISPNWVRWLLLGGLLVSAATMIYSVFMSTSTMTLVPYEINNVKMFMPKSDFERAVGIYPVLAWLGTVVVTLYFLIYAFLAVRAWQTVSKEVPESVA